MGRVNRGEQASVCLLVTDVCANHCRRFPSLPIAARVIGSPPAPDARRTASFRDTEESVFTSPHVGQSVGLNAGVFGSPLRMQRSVEMITCDDSASAVDSSRREGRGMGGAAERESERRSQPSTGRGLAGAPRKRRRSSLYLSLTYSTG